MWICCTLHIYCMLTNKLLACRSVSFVKLHYRPVISFQRCQAPAGPADWQWPSSQWTIPGGKSLGYQVANGPCWLTMTTAETKHSQERSDLPWEFSHRRSVIWMPSFISCSEFRQRQQILEFRQRRQILVHIWGCRATEATQATSH